jgi:hypothetical protein
MFLLKPSGCSSFDALEGLVDFGVPGATADKKWRIRRGGIVQLW